MSRTFAPDTCLKCKKKVGPDGFCHDRCLPEAKRQYNKNPDAKRWRK